VPDSSGRAARLRRSLTTPHGLLVIVCALHLLLVFVFVVARHMWWEQDETVYLSQVAAHTPALRFTPPRARGMPVLLFPMVHFTTRLGLVRSYVGVLGTAAMYLGFRPWLRLGLGRVVAVAALLFTTLWATTFFGAEMQPNYMVAAVSLAVVGYTILAIRNPDRRRYLVIAGAATALVALIRPSDATWLVAGALVTLLGWRVVERRRRAVVGAALFSGLVLGWSEWVIEAYTNYGGFFHRLHAANAENTPGVHFSLLTQLRAVDGPTLCRPCQQAVSAPHILWLIAIPPLVAVGLVAARGTRRFVPLVAATLAATAVLGEYVLTVAYAAPRFLLPAYALYALPCAAGAAALLRWRPLPRLAWATPAVLFVVLLAQIGSQTYRVHHVVTKYVANRGRYVPEAATLRQAGVRPPCLLNGRLAAPVAFAMGCNDHPSVRPGQPPPVGAGTTIVEFGLPGTYPASVARQIPVQHTVRGQAQVAYIFPPGAIVPMPLIPLSQQPRR
jgi:hypothetical protein